MKRFTAIRVLSKAIPDDGISIYIGDGVSKEGYKFSDSSRSLYFSDDTDNLLSMVLGIAMNTRRKVFVFCEDQYFIRDISDLMQIGVSKCKNLFCILLVSNRYIGVDYLPTIFGSVNSPHGILYNMGFLVHDYTKIFKFNRNPINKVREYWLRANGPVAIILNVDHKNNKKFDTVKLSNYSDINNLTEFISEIDGVKEL